VELGPQRRIDPAAVFPTAAAGSVHPLLKVSPTMESSTVSATDWYIDRAAQRAGIADYTEQCRATEQAGQLERLNRPGRPQQTSPDGSKRLAALRQRARAALVAS
jgi:hypothetical protein